MDNSKLSPGAEPLPPKHANQPCTSKQAMGTSVHKFSNPELQVDLPLGGPAAIAENPGKSKESTFYFLRKFRKLGKEFNKTFSKKQHTRDPIVKHDKYITSKLIKVDASQQATEICRLANGDNDLVQNAWLKLPISERKNHVIIKPTNDYSINDMELGPSEDLCDLIVEEERHITFGEASCQTDMINRGTSTACGDIEDLNENLDNEIVKIPSRKHINSVLKKKESVKVYSKLYYHLKIKYHLKHRDHQLINQLVHEARNWLKNNDHTCDNMEDYTIMSSAVLAAFMVSSEELQFRAMIKKRTQLDNVNHLNSTLKGDLGEMYDIPPLHSFIGSGLKSVRMDGPKVSI